MSWEFPNQDKGCNHDGCHCEEEGEMSVPIELDFPSKIAKVFKKVKVYDLGIYGDSLSYGIEKFKSLIVNVNLYGHTKKIDDVELRGHFMLLEEGMKMVTAIGLYKRYERLRESIVTIEGVKWFMFTHKIKKKTTHVSHTYLTNVDEKSFLKVRMTYKKQIKKNLVNHIQRFIEELSKLAYNASDYQRNLIYQCNFCHTKSAEPLKRCSRCKKANYCSRECQKYDWKEHKKICISN